MKSITEVVQNLLKPYIDSKAFGDLKGKTIAIFGASNEIASYTQNTNWVDVLEDILDGYATVINKSVAARGIIQAITDYKNDADRADYDIVIFCCTKNQYRAQIPRDVMDTDLWVVPNIVSAINSLSSYKSLEQKIYFASCTPYPDSVKAFPMCTYDGAVKKAVENNGFLMLDMHSWLGTSDANSNAYLQEDGLHFKAEVAPIFAARCLKALLAGNEPFGNYSVKLVGADVWAWLTTYCSVNQNLAYDATQGAAVLYTDLNHNVYLWVAVENTGSEIPAYSMLIDSQNSYNIITSPSWTALERTNAYGNIKITNRAFGVRTEVAIPSGTKFLLTFGTVDGAISV